LPYGYSYKSILCHIGHPGTLTLSPGHQSARMSKITNDGLARSGTKCCTHRLWQQWASKCFSQLWPLSVMQNLETLPTAYLRWAWCWVQCCAFSRFLWITRR